jgi:hypothetical protein
VSGVDVSTEKKKKKTPGFTAVLAHKLTQKALTTHMLNK